MANDEFEDYCESELTTFHYAPIALKMALKKYRQIKERRKCVNCQSWDKLDYHCTHEIPWVDANKFSCSEFQYKGPENDVQ